MAVESAPEITRLLQAWGDGDERALEQLMPLVYEELRQAAHRYMAREAPGHTLQTTALVNEVYLRLAGVRRGRWHSCAQFFALCAKLMRRILTDFARSPGHAPHVALDEALLVSQEPRADLLALHEALQRLETLVVRLLDPTAIADALRRAERSPTMPFDATLARELAQREHVKAVVQGEIDPVGTGYVLSASLIAAADGHVLTALRETAANEAGLISAVDRLSRELRARMGESLKSIRAGPPLAHCERLPEVERNLVTARYYETADYDWPKAGYLGFV